MLALVKQFAQLVDVAARTDNLYMTIVLAMFRQIAFHLGQHIIAHSSAKKSQCTYVIGTAVHQFTLMDDGNLCTSATHINKGIGALVGIDHFNAVVVE